jgi:hypothetical protein
MEFRMRKHIAMGIALMLGASGSAFAEGVSYNLLEGGYGYTDFKGLPGHGDSFAVGGSYGFADSFYGLASVGRSDYKGLKGTSLAAGAGWHMGLSDTVDFLADLSFLVSDTNISSSDTGFGAGIGVRGRMGMSVELNGDVNYVDFGGGADGFVFGVGGNYYFAPKFAGGLNFSMDDSGDSKTVGVTFRYDFGG